MTALRETDVRLKAMASRLKLSYTRDHLQEMLDEAGRVNLTPRETLEYFFAQEITQRDANRIRQGMMLAHFPIQRTLEEYDFSAQPTVDPGKLRELSSMDWVAAGENVAFFGPAGVGKTHLTVGLCKKAIEQGYSVRCYYSVALVDFLKKAAKEGLLEAKLRLINKPNILIIDELGYELLGEEAAYLLYQLVNRRYEKKSIIVTTNRAPSEWGEIFGGCPTTVAILDRLLHHCTTMTIQGESYRLRENKKRNIQKQVDEAGKALMLEGAQTQDAM